MSKVAWVIGASTGIGKALSQKLSTEGYTVALSARTEEALSSFREELEALGSYALCVPCDVTDLESLKNAKEMILKDFKSIDLMVFAAGIYTPMSLKHYNHQQSLETLNVNLTGAFNVFETLKEEALSEKKCHLVWISSVAGYRGLPNSGAYGVSKAALINFAEIQRIELENHNTKVQVVNPGFVKTRLTDKNDFPMPSLLTSEQAADYIYNGLFKGVFEINFPPLFAFSMKTLRIMPNWLYIYLVQKLLKEAPQ